MQANRDGFGICRKELSEAINLLRSKEIDVRADETNFVLYAGDKKYRIVYMLGGEVLKKYVWEILDE